MDTAVPVYATTLSEYDDFFARYAVTFEQSLSGRFNADAIRSFYAEYFVSISENGPVRGSKNDGSFVHSVRKAHEFYRQVGMKALHIEAIAVLHIHDGHDRVRVSYVAHHRRQDGTPVDLPFDVTYLVQKRLGGPRIFGFIAGDEMELYRDAGLIDDDGKPI